MPDLFSAFLCYNELANNHCNDVKVTMTRMEIRIRQSKTDQYHNGDTALVARTLQSTWLVGLMKRYTQMAGINLDSIEYQFWNVRKMK